jgi:inner membrane protein involved in colicin E2 resistance
MSLKRKAKRTFWKKITLGKAFDLVAYTGVIAFAYYLFIVTNQLYADLLITLAVAWVGGVLYILFNDEEGSEIKETVIRIQHK